MLLLLGVLITLVILAKFMFLNAIKTAQLLSAAIWLLALKSVKSVFSHCSQCYTKLVLAVKSTIAVNIYMYVEWLS